jgi:predicted nucleic acid-binding protein
LTALVVDASVAVKWCLPEAGESLVWQARRLLACHSRGELRFLVPDLFWAEFGNVMGKAMRKGRTSPSQTAAALGLIRELGIPTFSSADLLPEALNIALPHECSVYDGLYVALAMRFRTEMITADERLANLLAARLPVKWLGAL